MRNLLDIWRPERTSPWREFNTLQRRMERLFGEFPESTLPALSELRRDIDFVPACDYEETDTHYLISMDAPGMAKDQIQVELRGNTLNISGDQREEKKEEKGTQKYSERYHGHFERFFTLPDVSDTEKVEAEYKDGVLRIAIPKAQAAKSRKIQIGEGKSGIFAKLVGKAEKEQKQSERAA